MKNYRIHVDCEFVLHLSKEIKTRKNKTVEFSVYILGNSNTPNAAYIEFFPPDSLELPDIHTSSIEDARKLWNYFVSLGGKIVKM